MNILFIIFIIGFLSGLVKIIWKLALRDLSIFLKIIGTPIILVFCLLYIPFELGKKVGEWCDKNILVN